jgi:hypothetical protein
MAVRRRVPAPSKSKRGQRLVAAKLAVFQAMLEEGVTQVELAARLHQDDRQVRRLLNVKHRSRFDMLERAFHGLGRQMVLEVKRVTKVVFAFTGTSGNAAKGQGQRPRFSRRPRLSKAKGQGPATG